MTVLGIIVASIVAYLLIGAIAARIFRTAIIASAHYREGDPYWRVEDGYYGKWRARDGDGIDRETVSRRIWLMMLGWPVYSWTFAVGRLTERAIDQVDPQLSARQAARIAELECELGMKS